MRSTTQPGLRAAPGFDVSESRRVLVLHNRYRQPGGEDAVVQSECELLREAGHEVSEYARHNSEIRSTPTSMLSLGVETVWSKRTYRAVSELLARERPQVAHFHNTFPLISPSAFQACRERGVPIVQTLHNYRLFCPGALFLRDGKICEECVEHSLWRSIRHGCYHDSQLKTAAVAASLAVLHRRRAVAEPVDCYIALTEFARRKFVSLGLPAAKVEVKPNFVHPDPGPGEGRGGYAVFVGRLSHEKGIRTALRAWRRLAGRIPLKIVGDGPDAPFAVESAARLDGVQWLGWLSNAETLRVIGDARFMVFPSEWYEGCPRVLIESFAKGTPVLAASLGAAAELVREGCTGLHFRAGDADHLANQALRMASEPGRLEELRVTTRREYLGKYTGDRNYQQLMSIYDRVRGGTEAG